MKTKSSNGIQAPVMSEHEVMRRVYRDTFVQAKGREPTSNDELDKFINERREKTLPKVPMWSETEAQAQQARKSLDSARAIFNEQHGRDPVSREELEKFSRDRIIKAMVDGANGRRELFPSGPRGVRGGGGR